MSYECNSCDMSIADLMCNKCNTKLVDDTITKNGKDIQVAKCPKCDGMIKSPQCCGKDMDAA